MPSTPDPKLPWWRHPWPWFLMALPMSAVLGSIVTIWLANSGADDLVSDDYYKDGLAIRQIVERDAKASQLGLVAKLTVQNGHLSIRLDGRLADQPVGLNLHLIHPTQAQQDIFLNLMATSDGRYTAPLPAMTAAKRQIRVEPEDRSWRLTGEWHSPFNGELILAAQP